MRIRQLHPFVRVGINTHVPIIDVVRMDAREKRKISRDHKALNMMGISMPNGLPQRIGQTGHIGFAGPV